MMFKGLSPSSFVTLWASILVWAVWAIDATSNPPLPTAAPLVESDAISFVDYNAYIKMDGFSPQAASPSQSSWTGGSLSFRVKTSSQMAVMFYSTGSSNSTHGDFSKHFVAVEVFNGRTALSINDGNGAVVLQHDTIINDGLWHEVLVVFSPGYLEVTVDGKRRTLEPKTSSGTRTNFQLTNDLFVGGIDSAHEQNALKQGLNTIMSEPETSLVGCIKEIRVNRKPIVSKDLKASKGVRFQGCYWQFICLLSEPCLDDAECFQEGLDGFHCLCDHDVCTRPNFNKSAIMTPPGHEVHHVQPTLRPTQHNRPSGSKKPKTSPAPKVSGTSNSGSSNSFVTSTKTPNLAPTIPVSMPPTSTPTVFDIVRPNLAYLNIVITREQVIIGAYIVTVIFVLSLVGILIREFYLLGRGKRRLAKESSKSNKRRGHKDERSPCAGNLYVSGESPGIASTSPMTMMTRCELSSHDSNSPCLELELDQGPPSTVSNFESNFGGSSIDSRQPLTQASQAINPDPSSSAIYSRIDRELKSSSTNGKNSRRESVLIYPLPPPSLFFSSRIHGNANSERHGHDSLNGGEQDMDLESRHTGHSCNGSRCCLYRSRASNSSQCECPDSGHHSNGHVTSTLGRRSGRQKMILLPHQKSFAEDEPGHLDPLNLSRMDPLKLLERSHPAPSDHFEGPELSELPPLKRFPWYRSCEDILPSPPASCFSSASTSFTGHALEKRKSRCFDCSNPSSSTAQSQIMTSLGQSQAQNSQILSIDRSRYNNYASFHSQQQPTFETFAPIPSPPPPPEPSTENQRQRPHYWI